MAPRRAPSPRPTGEHPSANALGEQIRDLVLTLLCSVLRVVTGLAVTGLKSRSLFT